MTSKNKTDVAPINNSIEELLDNEAIREEIRQAIREALISYEKKQAFFWDMEPEKKFQASLPKPSYRKSPFSKPSWPEPFLIRRL